MATILDPDTLLALCKKCDGYDGAVQYLAEQGLKNPKTGRPFSKRAIVYTVQQAKDFPAWRSVREKERANVQKEFARIAARMVATKAKQKGEK